ncbi:hypothetical protein DFQ26_004256 [Actinomortierella ambigua]|nr:hypothetical protein DFQ26_004256 [Actinomortierella ambigua]
MKALTTTPRCHTMHMPISKVTPVIRQVLRRSMKNGQVGWKDRDLYMQKLRNIAALMDTSEDGAEEDASPLTGIITSELPLSSGESRPALKAGYSRPDLDDTQDTGQDTEMMDTDDPSLFGDQASKEEAIPLPKATRSTAKYLQGVSYTNELVTIRTRQQQRRWKRWKKRKKDEKGKGRKTEGSSRSTWTDDDDDGQAAREAMKQISMTEHSLNKAVTMEEVNKCTEARRQAHEPIRKVENHHRLVHMRRTQELRKRRDKASVAAGLKRRMDEYSVARGSDPSTARTVDAATGYCSACQTHHATRLVLHKEASTGSQCSRLEYDAMCRKAKPAVVSVFAYGSAGHGVGSKIRGHVRMEPALSRQLKGTEIKTRKVHGSMCCKNPDCLFVKGGYASRPRDTNAAVGILLSVVSSVNHEEGGRRSCSMAHPPVQSLQASNAGACYY